MTDTMTKTCTLCERGFRRKDGMHLPSQRLGMIPVTACDAVQALKLGEPNQTLTFKGGPGRQWSAWVDGKILRDARGVGRGFATEDAALRAARKAAQ